MLGDLRGHGRDTGEQQPEPAHRRAVDDRALGGEVLAHEREGDQRAEHGEGHGRDHEHGGDRGVATEHGGAQQLGPAVLLVGPGVAADEEHAHQGHDRVAEGAHVEHDLAAERVEAVVRALEGEEGGVVACGRGRRVEVGLGGVEVLDAGCRRQHQQHDAGDPHGQAHPVAPEDEAHQRPRASERAALRRAGRFPRRHGRPSGDVRVGGAHGVGGGHRAALPSSSASSSP